MEILAPLQLPTQVRAPASAATASASATRDGVAQRKLEQARDALTKVTAARDNQKDTAKAIARKKVQDLRDMLKAARFMFANDPKALARLLARIAHDLGAAVKDYLAAGGSTSDVGDVGGQPQTAGANASPADGTDGAEATATTVATESRPRDTPARAGKQQGSTDRRSHAQVNAYRDRIEQHGTDARAQDEQADADFMRDARDLGAQLKALSRRLKDRSDPDDAETADRDLQGVELDLAAATTSLTATAVSGAFLSLSA